MNYLVIVDMQNDFVTGSLGSKEAQQIVENVKKKIQTFSGIVLYTRDTHMDNYLTTQEGKKLPVTHCIKNSTGWNIIDEIEELRIQANAVTFNKPTFGSLELAEFLKKENQKNFIESVELIGLCTDICVISNAILLKSVLLETEIKVDSSCCAGVTKESHNNALKAMQSCQISVY